MGSFFLGSGTYQNGGVAQGGWWISMWLGEVGTCNCKDTVMFKLERVSTCGRYGSNMTIVQLLLGYPFGRGQYRVFYRRIGCVVQASFLLELGRVASNRYEAKGTTVYTTWLESACLSLRPFRVSPNTLTGLMFFTITDQVQMWFSIHISFCVCLYLWWTHCHREFEQKL